ncbi:MAG: 16S rRNA (cytidine(1402)-2'-O)-methyltransferase [Alphaproteobacteria bacterium]|nr:16S rRNA (cytidine(1402)-2'-O)-methyltransferase [Alphaproteobacteria bacterium]
MTVTRDPIRGQPNHSPGASKSGETPGLAAGLYIVATPIGNLGDITRRAVSLLGQVDILAAEDTRSARRLCAALGLATPRLVRYDDHADQADRDRLIQAVKQGKSVALISDAGMPLVADPGLKLVQAAQQAGIPVTALPGPSAALTALALSGLPSDRFLFAGFLPAKAGARRRALAELAAVPATLILFETGPRLGASLAAMHETLGARPAAVCRELTKLFEEVRRGSLAELAAAYAEADAPRGEIVVVIGPPTEAAPAAAEDIDTRLSAALATMSLRDAVTAVAATTGRQRREIYARALALDHQHRGGKP